jgi:putative redox protein
LKVCIRHMDGHTFMAKSDSNHWVPFDTGLPSGGSGAANDPFQLFIIACGGCVSIDVVDILTKGRKEFDLYELNVEASRADHTPKIVRALTFHARVNGENVTEENVRRALELSLTKYCSVSLSLDRSVTFTGRVTLNGHRGESWQIPRNPELYDRD